MYIRVKKVKRGDKTYEYAHLVNGQWKKRRIKTIEGKMQLTEGYHDIKIKYFNSAGSSHIKVFWEIPDGLRCLLGEDNVYNYLVEHSHNQKE